MALDAAQVNQLQNSVPTDFRDFDAALDAQARSNDARFADDGKLHVRFFSAPDINQRRSHEEQRPVYEDTDFIEILIPGDKLNMIRRKADELDKARFAKQYDAYKAGRSQVVGTPLLHSGIVSPAQAEELKFFHVHTVEQLATLNDNVKFLGADILKRKAQEWLQKMTGNDATRAELAETQRKLAELQALVEGLTAPKGKKGAKADAEPAPAADDLDL